jgi:hypothetical protein
MNMAKDYVRHGIVDRLYCCLTMKMKDGPRERSSHDQEQWHHHGRVQWTEH